MENMNREIKFRAFDKITKQMFYGVSMLSAWNNINKCFDMEYGNTVCSMNTGLKEHCNEYPKENKEIYEGDIIEFIDGEKLVVEWNDDTCVWQYSDGSPINDHERYGTYKKIIGNIYEHPHLLSSTKAD